MVPFSRSHGGGGPFSIEHPQDDFSLQMRDGDGRFLCNSIQTMQRGGCQSLWRVPISILEAEIMLGVLSRKGGTPDVRGKWGPFVIFPVLCLLAFGDTALKF